MKGSKSASIFLGIIVLFAIIWVLYSAIKKQGKDKSLAEFAKAQGWDFIKGTEGNISYKIIGPNWHIEAKSSTQGPIKTFSSVLIWTALVPELKTIETVIAIRMPVDPDILARSMLPDELKNSYKEVQFGNQDFTKKFITLSQGNTSINKNQQIIEKLLTEFTTEQKPAFLALSISNNELKIKTARSEKNEEIMKLINFGTALHESLK